MEENKESNSGIIENLALLTDGLQTLFPDGKIICVYELNNEDFKKVQGHFRKIDQEHKRFSVDMSGLEHVFIHEDFVNESMSEKEVIETPPKKTVKQKILSWLKSGGSSVK
jgi:hypothetical protein